MIKVATAFSGAGLTAYALRKMGCELVFGIECDPQIAKAYRDNHGDNVIFGKIEDVVNTVDLTELIKPRELDLFQASPSCKEFSRVKPNGNPGINDEMAIAGLCKLVEILQPKIIVIEQVTEFLDHPIEKRLTRHLEDFCQENSGIPYRLSHQILNAADFGTPQNRKRLFITGIRDDLYGNPKIELPPMMRYQDWYGAIADLIQPTDYYTPFEGSWYKNGVDAGKDLPPRLPGILERVPVSIVPVAIELVGGKGVYSSGMPFHTIRSLGRKSSHQWHRHLIYYPDGRIVKFTPRMLARIMGLRDDFILPNNACLAGEVLGNGVCVEVMQVVARQLLSQTLTEGRKYAH